MHTLTEKAMRGRERLRRSALQIGVVAAICCIAGLKLYPIQELLAVLLIVAMIVGAAATVAALVLTFRFLTRGSAPLQPIRVEVRIDKPTDRSSYSKAA